MRNATISAQAPSYAPDGSQGYCLTVTGERPASGWTVSGWIHVGDDGRTVYASIDGAPSQSVGTVASPAELTIDWIDRHADEIQRPF
ncbi:hypothetical protein H7J87_11750 [Mycolicibacterium wolinskyi]|uniref:Uncharacterized protein n=1 Tax=Mycolicibacterium wolinskyi TaxID=59750 RepID=A0A1X2FJ01_9MYCO|nr:MULTISPECIES: hypothetical protein [Mycolicibacterium]MCV7286004.1 hypothetical protein [Mycolicibacterium wolinskyi]MCV7296200.1 hypothetical protein [Mycolicibacterium goodii]ORX18431.1 hypothetical protein AWC31_14100 [Mycolicibacterium wolinskyi]